MEVKVEQAPVSDLVNRTKKDDSFCTYRKLNKINQVICFFIENTSDVLKTAHLLNLANWYRHGNEYDGIKISLKQSTYDMFFLQNISKKVTFTGLQIMAVEEGQLKNIMRVCGNTFYGSGWSNVYSPYEKLVGPIDEREIKTQLDDTEFYWEWQNDSYMEIDINPGEKFTMVFTIASIEDPGIPADILEKARKYDQIKSILE